LFSLIPKGILVKYISFGPNFMALPFLKWAFGSAIFVPAKLRLHL